MASAQARERAKAAAAGEPIAAPASAVAAANVLDDPATQQKIIDPNPEFTMIAGKEVKLHKLAGKYSRMLAGLAVQIFQDGAAHAGNGGASSQRLMAILNGPTGADFIPLLALSMQKAGESTWEAAVYASHAIENEIAYDEVGWAYFKMLQLNKTMDILQATNTSQSRPN